MLVGAIGLEPTTPTMSRWCSNQLSYAPAKGRTIPASRRVPALPGRLARHRSARPPRLAMKPSVVSLLRSPLLCISGLAAGRADRRGRHRLQAHRPRPQDRRRRLRRPEGRAASPATSRAPRPAASAARSASPRTSRRPRSPAARSARSRSSASRSSCARRCSTSASRSSSSSLRVVRMVDRKRNTLVYLTYSDRVIEGSPQNSVTAVPVDRAHADSRCADPPPALSGAAPSARRGRGTRARAPRRASDGVGDLDREGHEGGAAGAVVDRLRAHAGDVDLLLGEHLGDVAQQAAGDRSPRR